MNQFFFTVFVFLICFASSFGQFFQFSLSNGPVFPYIVEEGTTEMNYFIGMGIQSDFIYPNVNQVPN